MPRNRALIAIVDDEEAVRKALQRLFRAVDLDATVFASGQAFLDSLETGNPTCAVLDLHMPGLTGLDVLRRLQARDDKFPSIIVTAYDEPDTAQLCLDAGAAAYLRKPVDDDLLLQTIRTTLVFPSG
jgi:FixJ family two-component response regulator